MGADTEFLMAKIKQADGTIGWWFRYINDVIVPTSRATSGLVVSPTTDRIVSLSELRQALTLTFASQESDLNDDLKALVRRMVHRFERDCGQAVSPEQLIQSLEFSPLQHPQLRPLSDTIHTFEIV